MSTLRSALEAMTTCAVVIFLSAVIVAVWLTADRWFGNGLSETQALQISADISNELAAESVAMRGQP